MRANAAKTVVLHAPARGHPSRLRPAITLGGARVTPANVCIGRDMFTYLGARLTVDGHPGPPLDDARRYAEEMVRVLALRDNYTHPMVYFIITAVIWPRLLYRLAPNTASCYS